MHVRTVATPVVSFLAFLQKTKKVDRIGYWLYMLIMQKFITKRISRICIALFPILTICFVINDIYQLSS